MQITIDYEANYERDGTILVSLATSVTLEARVEEYKNEAGRKVTEVSDVTLVAASVEDDDGGWHDVPKGPLFDLVAAIVAANHEALVEKFHEELAS